MPVLARIRERFEREQPLDGTRIGACLHVTTETANLMRTLIAGGARGRALRQQSALDPGRGRRRAGRALRRRRSTPSTARTPTTYYRHIDAVCDIAPQITIDDGADVIGALHTARARSCSTDVIGGTEETTTGVIRLKALEREGKLAYPVIAVNEAETSTSSTTATAPASRRSTASCARPTS